MIPQDVIVVFRCEASGAVLFVTLKDVVSDLFNVMLWQIRNIKINGELNAMLYDIDDWMWDQNTTKHLLVYTQTVD